MAIFIILWCFSLTGYGYLFLNQCIPAYKNNSDSEKTALAILCGCICIVFFSLTLNFWFPVTQSIATLFFGIGLIMFVLQVKKIAPALTLPGLLVIITIAIYMNHLAAHTVKFPLDTAVYHLQAVRWTAESRVLPGLANLEGKLGFNSIWFPLAAALGSLGMESRGPFIINGLLFIAYALLLLSAYQKFKTDHKPTLSLCFITGSVFIVIYELLLKREILYPSNDVPLLLLMLSMSYLALKNSETGQVQKSFPVIMLLCLMALMIKLSSVLPFAILLVLSFYFNVTASEKDTNNSSLIFVLFLMFLTVAWLLRGVILSGCLFYPSTFGCFSGVKWRVPQTSLIGEIDVIRQWARVPFYAEGDKALQAWNWLKPWLSDFLSQLSIRFNLALLFIGACLMLKNIKAIKISKTTVVIFLIALASVIFWFLNAPALRFGLPYIHILCLIPFSLGFEAFLKPRSSREKKNWLRFFIFLSCLPVLMTLRVEHLSTWHWPKVKDQAYNAVENPYSTRINVPHDKMLCWTIPLPCAPFLREDLRTETKNDKPDMFFYDASAHNR